LYSKEKLLPICVKIAITIFFAILVYLAILSPRSAIWEPPFYVLFIYIYIYGISFTEKPWDLPQKKALNGRGPRTVMTAEDDGRLQRRQHPGRWAILGVPLNQFTLALKNKLPFGYLM
jgi:hypothetical protein